MSLRPSRKKSEKANKTKHLSRFSVMLYGLHPIGWRSYDKDWSLPKERKFCPTLTLDLSCSVSSLSRSSACWLPCRYSTCQPRKGRRQFFKTNIYVSVHLSIFPSIHPLTSLFISVMSFCVSVICVTVAVCWYWQPVVSPKDPIRITMYNNSKNDVFCLLNFLSVQFHPRISEFFDRLCFPV